MPVIAAIDGVCIGGALEFAASCDLRIGTERARFATPEVRIGLGASNAGTLLLPEVLGESAARELLLTGALKDAAWMDRHGFFNALVPADGLDAAVAELAAAFDATTAPAVTRTKRMLNERFGDLLPAAMERETLTCVELFDTPEAQEAVQRFAPQGLGNSLMRSGDRGAEHGRMLITDPPGIDPSSLRDRMSGRVSAPGDLDWDEARQAWNVAVDQRPAAVAIPHSVDDVIAIVDFANERGLRVTAQGTGHNAGAFDTLADTILVKTQEMRGVEIDAEARVARVAAGTLWIEVTEPASALGLAPLAGSSPDVGVVGYSLGGGASWLARKYGLSSNSVVAIELVTADGELVRADAEHHADLFWALRGGGGNYGVVTHMEIRLYPLTEVYAGMMFWPWERSAEVLKAWAAWTRTAPDEVTTSARLMQIPPLPGHPGVPPGPRPDRDRRRLRRRRGLRRRTAPAAARPRARDGHVRDDAAGRPVADPHGPRGPDARHRRRRAHARRAHRRGDRRLRRRGRPGLRHGAADERAAPPRRRPGPRARGPRRARALRTAST